MDDELRHDQSLRAEGSGPDPLSGVSPTFQASPKVYVDGYGYKTYGEVEHQMAGNVLQNVCAFAADYSTGSSDGPQTLKPYEVTRIGVGFLGSMFNVNTLRFR
jgi:hypothetical protein